MRTWAFLFCVFIFARTCGSHNVSWSIGGNHTRRQLSEAPLANERPRPFLVLFTSSVGSSWLMQELSVDPAVCVIGHEPLDDFCAAGKSSGNAKRQLGWLQVVLRPPSLDEYSEHLGQRTGRGEAWKAAWRRWKVALMQHALPCRVEEVILSAHTNNVHYSITDTALV